MRFDGIEDLKKFVISSVASSYAAGDAANKKKETDGSTTIEYKSGRFILHDNYFGGEPYGGREVVYFDGKPVWMMVYYGWVQEPRLNKAVYTFLMSALMNPPIDFPFRGPNTLKQDTWFYENTWSGDAIRFSGVEKIFMDGELVYEATYSGGLVDQ